MPSVKDLLKPLKKDRQKVSNTTLGSALEASSNSHDPVFVFDKTDKFIGLTSPHYAIFKKRYPYSSNVSTATINPPHIEKRTSLFDVAKHMLSTKMYSLPVFENEKITGTISASDILEALLNEPEALKIIKKNIILKDPITEHINSTVAKARTKLKKHNISRLLLVDDSNKLVGILTRRDLQEAYTTPNRKLRFGKNKGKQVRSYSFDDEKIKREDYPIKEFYRMHVETLESGKDIAAAIKKMLSKNVGSIVFIDEDNKPTSLISTHTILQALADATPKDTFKIKLTDKRDILSEKDTENVLKHLQKLLSKYDKISKIRSTELRVDGHKNTAGKFTAFEISASIQFTSGDTIKTHTTQKTIKTALAEVVKTLDHLIQKKHRLDTKHR